MSPIELQPIKSIPEEFAPETPVISSEELIDEKSVRLSIARQAMYAIGNKYIEIISFPKTRPVEDIAYGDNRMIAEKKEEIKRLREQIVENHSRFAHDDNYSKFSLDNANKQIYSQIRTLRKDIDILKTSKVTAASMNSSGKGVLVHNLGGFSKLKDYAPQKF